METVELQRNPHTRQMERAALTGDWPTLSNIDALRADGRPNQLARVHVDEKGILRLRWWEPVE